jgi:ElaB/YqjD/DUF883 family membrane-anchored ribosome-binding protein
MQAKSSRTSNGAKSAGSSLIARTASSAHHTVDRLANAAPPIIDRAAAGAHQTVDNVAKRLKPAGAWIEDSTQKLQQKKLNAVAAGRSYIQDNPFQVVGGALALGLLLGQLSHLVTYLTRDRD